MGLDVYLYKKTADAAEFKRRQDASAIIEEKSSAVYDDPTYKTMTDEQKDALYEKSKEISRTEAALLDVPLDEYDSVLMPEEKVKIDSAKYPEHYFKIGYFRSSYNSGGINSVMGRLSLPDLYAVLGYERVDDYLFTPDWAATKQRALAAAEAIRSLDGGDIDIMSISPNVFIGEDKLPKSEQEVRTLVLAELKKSSSFGDSGYSNGIGNFYPKGIQVLAMVPGLDDSFTKALFNKPTPCVYVAFRKEGGNKWYAEAMEIVAETCDWVLSQEDPTAYHLHWSS